MKKILNNKTVKILLLILIGTTFLFETPYDPDFGWHYKYGEYFFQNGKLLKENIFSYTYPDYEWVSSYWIPQILIYISYHFLGNTVPAFLASLIFSVILFLLLKNYSDDLFSISFVFLLIIFSLKSFVITVRPLYFSTLFLLLLMSILLKKNNNKNYIPLIFLIWANTHADFLLGLFVLGVYCTDNFLKITSAPSPNFKKITSPFKNRVYLTTYFNSLKKYFGELIKNKNTSSILVNNFWILAASIVATLINPYGFKLWAVLIKELNQPFRSFVREWLPPQNINFLSSISNIFISMGLIFSILPYKNTNEEHRWNRFIIIFFYILGIKSVYFSRISIISASFLVLKNIEMIKKDVSPIIKNKLKNIPSFTPTVFLLFLSGFTTNVFVNNFFLSLNLKEWSVKKNYPYEAVSYIKSNPIEGNMLNDYSWGGYLIWQLPEYKTFIDGRMTAWRDDKKYLMEDYQKIFGDTDKNKALLDEYVESYDIGWILSRPDSNVIKFLKENRSNEWEIVFEDGVSTILRKMKRA